MESLNFLHSSDTGVIFWLSSVDATVKDIWREIEMISII